MYANTWCILSRSMYPSTEHIVYVGTVCGARRTCIQFYIRTMLIETNFDTFELLLLFLLWLSLWLLLFLSRECNNRTCIQIISTRAPNLFFCLSHFAFFASCDVNSFMFYVWANQLLSLLVILFSNFYSPLRSARREHDRSRKCQFWTSFLSLLPSLAFAVFQVKRFGIKYCQRMKCAK